MKKIFLKMFLVAIVFAVSSCTKSPYEKAVDYIDGLTKEVVSVTNETEFDSVYKKVVRLSSNELMKNLTDLSIEEKTILTKKAINLTKSSLAVKAILFVMPKDITPTSQDMEKLVDECLKKKLKITSFPYDDVRSLVRNHYNSQN